MLMGLCTRWVLLSDQVKKPKTVKESPGARFTAAAAEVVAVTCTVKDNFWFTAAKESVEGSTEIFTPLGANTVAVYTARAWPTFVTVLVRVVDRIEEDEEEEGC